MDRPRRHWLLSVAFSVSLLALVALALSGVAGYFVFIMLAGIAACVAIIYRLFPDSRFFSLALTDFLSVYICLFIFFVEANFWPLSLWAIYFGFLLPIVCFLVGVFWHRDQIRAVLLATPYTVKRSFVQALRWLVPIFAIGVATFFVPALQLDQLTKDLVFLAAMAGIGLVVVFVARGISLFLIDAGLLFDAFFSRIAEMAMPAFAFFTFYSLTVIVFAAIYRIIDRYSSAHHFFVNGEPKSLGFPESLYFSIVTLSTVGYGDITPQSDVIRVIIAIEIVLGVMLMLFGFYEIMTYAREQRRHPGD